MNVMYNSDCVWYLLYLSVNIIKRIPNDSNYHPVWTTNFIKSFLITYKLPRADYRATLSLKKLSIANVSGSELEKIYPEWISPITKLNRTRLWTRRRGHHRPIERTPITRPRNKILNFCRVVNPSLERIRALRYNRNASTPTRPCCISDLSPLEAQPDYTHSNKRPFSDNEYFSVPMKARSNPFFFVLVALVRKKASSQHRVRDDPNPLIIQGTPSVTGSSNGTLLS